MHFCRDSLDKRTCWKVQIPCQVPDGGEDSMSTGRWGTRCMVHCDPFMGTANNRGLPPTSMPFSLLGEEWRSSWIWVWLNDWIWRNHTRLYLYKLNSVGVDLDGFWCKICEQKSSKAANLRETATGGSLKSRRFATVAQRGLRTSEPRWSWSWFSDGHWPREHRRAAKFDLQWPRCSQTRRE